VAGVRPQARAADLMGRHSDYRHPLRRPGTVDGTIGG
jgi:hypothetical protein